MTAKRLACAGMIALVLSGCDGSGRVPLMVYSPHGKEMLSAFEAAFEAEHPDVDVLWLDMGSQDVYDRVRTERSNPQADVWWGAPSLTFIRAEQESLLERYLPSWDSALSAGQKSPGGFWSGTFVTPEVILYNNRVITADEAPRDWDDLLHPKWKDRIIIRYPLASGTMRIIFSALIQRGAGDTGRIEDGMAWLGALDANTKSYVADPTQLYLKIAREDGVLSLWNLPDVIIQKELNGYPFGFRIPESGTPLIIDCIAIVRGTKHFDAAVRFYEYVTSRESLLRQAREFYRIPARQDMDRKSFPEWLKDLQFPPMSLDWDAIQRNEQEWMRYWDQNVKGRGGRR
jgi:iron(III) transport system substrate-binding protein